MGRTVGVGQHLESGKQHVLTAEGKEGGDDTSCEGQHGNEQSEGGWLRQVRYSWAAKGAGPSEVTRLPLRTHPLGTPTIQEAQAMLSRLTEPFETQPGLEELTSS